MSLKKGTNNYTITGQYNKCHHNGFLSHYPHLKDDETEAYQETQGTIGQ